jgi:hypothetical protein
LRLRERRLNLDVRLASSQMRLMLDVRLSKQDAIQNDMAKCTKCGKAVGFFQLSLIRRECGACRTAAKDAAQKHLATWGGIESEFRCPFCSRRLMLGFAFHHSSFDGGGEVSWKSGDERPIEIAAVKCLMTPGQYRGKARRAYGCPDCERVTIDLKE